MNELCVGDPQVVGGVGGCEVEKVSLMGPTSLLLCMCSLIVCLFGFISSTALRAV